MRTSRSRGAVSGLLLVLLGLWGGLIPFVGPYFDFAIGPNQTWDYTEGRLYLEILPAAVTVLGGLILLGSANRASGGLGGWLAIAGGAWFVIGPQMSKLWNDGVIQAGAANGSNSRQVLEQLTFFYGLGALIVALGAFALGRMAVRSVRDAELADEHGGGGRGRDAPLTGREGTASRARRDDESGSGATAARRPADR